MAEHCPIGVGIYWENEGEIPQPCVEHCGQFMTSDASVSEDGKYDHFLPRTEVDEYDEVDECHHLNLEHGDCSLQRAGGVNSAKRVFGVTDQCMGCGEEYGAQSYTFECPYN